MTTVSTTLTSVSYGELIRGNRNFRLAWFGQIISLTGDWFDLIASATLLGSLTKSGLAIGGLFVIRMLAPFVVTPFAGVLADRYNRKMLLVITDALRAVIVLGFLLVRRPEDVWILYTVTGLQLALSGIYFPARNAILPDIVSPRELAPANALTATTWSTMLALGAGIGGLASGLIGPYPAFVLDALSFVLSAMLQNRITYDHTPPANQGKVTLQLMFQQYIDGLRYLRHNLDILYVTLHPAVLSLILVGGFQIIMVDLSTKTFVIGQQGGISLGIMFGVLGVGTGIGPIVARRIAGDAGRPVRLAIAAGYGLNMIALFLMATLASFPVVLIAMLLRGIATAMTWVQSSQLLLQLLPNRVRGRVFSTQFAMQSLGAAASSAFGGWAIDHVGGGVPTMLVWMGFLIIIPGVFWLLWTFYGKVAETQLDDDSMLIPRTVLDPPKAANK